MRSPRRNNMIAMTEVVLQPPAQGKRCNYQHVLSISEYVYCVPISFFPIWALTAGRLVVLALLITRSRTLLKRQRCLSKFWQLRIRTWLQFYTLRNRSHGLDETLARVACNGNRPRGPEIDGIECVVGWMKENAHRYYRVMCKLKHRIR